MKITSNYAKMKSNTLFGWLTSNVESKLMLTTYNHLCLRDLYLIYDTADSYVKVEYNTIFKITCVFNKNININGWWYCQLHRIKRKIILFYLIIIIQIIKIKVLAHKTIEIYFNKTTKRSLENVDTHRWI